MKKAIMVLMAVMLLAATASAAHTWATGPAILSVDVNGFKEDQTTAASSATDDGVLCTPDDGNFTVNIRFVTPGTGIGFTFVGKNGESTAVKGGLDGNGYWEPDDENIHTTTAPGGADGHAQISVAAPSTEGYQELCVHDTNAWDTNTDCEFIGVQPDSTITDYVFETSVDRNGLCLIRDPAAFQGDLIRAGYGKIEFKESTDISSDIDYTDVFTWEKNKLTVNLSANAENLNDIAMKITFTDPKISSANFEIHKDGDKCGVCRNVRSDNGEISFETTGFSIYEIKEVASGTGGGVAFRPRSVIPTVDIGGAAAAVGGTQNLALLVIGVIIAIIVVAKLKK